MNERKRENRGQHWPDRKDVGIQGKSLELRDVSRGERRKDGTWRVGRLCRLDLGHSLLAFADSNYETLHKLVFLIARLSVRHTFCLRERATDGVGDGKLATFF